jgi:hypothetical protein
LDIKPSVAAAAAAACISICLQPHMAIVGANAFSHESGMHQDGILKHRETYQIMTPETIGLPKDSEFDFCLTFGQLQLSSSAALTSHTA